MTLPEPLESDDAVTFAISTAYALGELSERERIATAVAELDEVWRTHGAQLYRDRCAERLAVMERRAAQNAGSTWRGRYPGGPVDFHTGRLLVHRIGEAA